MLIDAMRTDSDMLGERAVYPGHPITVALCIVRHYPSLEVATSPYQDQDAIRVYSNALSDGAIPGAGGNVHLALDLLWNLSRGIPFESAIALSDTDWAQCDSQAKGGYITGRSMESREFYLKRWQAGQDQADRFSLALQKEVTLKWGGAQ